MDYERVAAVDGARLSGADRARLVDEKAIARSPDWLRPGVVGASLSHLEVYTRIIASDAACALVVEDDMSLGQDLGPLVEAVERELVGREVALLYYRSLKPCAFSSLESVAVGRGHELMYPLELEFLNAAGAYVVTHAAARRMLELLRPIRAGADSWGLFHDLGALERIRCVVPRPVNARTDLKSTIDYLGAEASYLQRAATAVADRRLFPLYQLLSWRRAHLERRMSRFSVVDEASPFSPTATS